jgi:hypothetical protein
MKYKGEDTAVGLWFLSGSHDPKVARFSKPARRAVSGYLPLIAVMGVEPTTPTLQGSVAPNGMQAPYSLSQIPPLGRVQ